MTAQPMTTQPMTAQSMTEQPVAAQPAMAQPMTAQEAVAYLESCGWSAVRLGLGRTKELLEKLGDPQKHLRFIHVAGSNGKGSTCAMFDAVLRAAGYRTGLYTSPYLQDFRERIQVNGEMIPGEALAALTERVRTLADAMEDHPSQFELVTALAMQYFYEQRCDVVVLEVGMGGALDSTNAIDAPELAVITNIGLEHTEYLGNTLEEIAATKAGIIKTGCACVCYDGAPEVTAVLREVCAQRAVPLTLAARGALQSTGFDLDGQDFSWKGTPFHLRLLGAHQLCNAALVLTGLEALAARGWRIPASAVAEGLREVRWPARLEVLGREPLFILDGGHNPQCAEALAQSLDRLLPGRRVLFLTGVLADKDYAGIFDRVLPCARGFVCVTPDSPRSLDAAALQAYLEARGARAVACGSIEEGVEKALELAGEEDAPVVAFGSLYLAGRVRSVFPALYRAWLRRGGIRARDGLSPEARAVGAARAVENIARSAAFQRARTVLLYRAVRGELDLEGLTRRPEAKGKRFAYPRCRNGLDMDALAPEGEDAWTPGPFGIPEPLPERAAAVAPEELDLVLCPCTRYDAACVRLGMGGGYYDRYLPRCTGAVVAAAAFAAQEAAQIPAEAWDVPMDLVFTDEGVYTHAAAERSAAPQFADPAEGREL